MFKKVVLSLLLLAGVAQAKPTIQGPSEPPLNVPGYEVAVVFAASDTAESDAVVVRNSCTLRAVIAGSDAVQVWAVPARTTTATSGTLLATFSTSSLASPVTFQAGTRYVKFQATTATTGGSIVFLTCGNSPSAAGSSGSAYGLSGANMTWQTVGYMSTMKAFEGLDPTITWTRYWVDPYIGSDSNDGSYDRPFKTFGKMKQMSKFGAWITIKNASRPGAMYMSQQTFPYTTTSGTCVVGELLTHNTSHNSRVLDIDYKNKIMVVESQTSTILASSTAVTGQTSGCSWTTGTKAPAIFDGSTLACAISSTTSCTVRYGTGECTGNTTCGAISEAAIAQTTTPTRYNQRVTVLWDVEDPSKKVIINADGRTIGDLTQAALGSGDDRNGVFIAHRASYGCLGVANIDVANVMDDVISQHEEGCVKTLNVYADRVLNNSTALNDNVITTHGGVLGRGGVTSVNGGGNGYRYSASGGSPIAPTAAGSGTGARSYMIIIGTGNYLSDMSTWGGGATKGQIVGATGGDVVLIGPTLDCKNTTTATATGCDGITVNSSQGTTNIKLARVLARPGTDSGTAGISFSSAGYPINLTSFRSFLRGDWLMYTNPASGAITFDIRGAIFAGAPTYYWWDQAAGSGTTGRISGIYDNDGSARWRTNAGSTVATAALMDAASPVDVFSDTYSTQTDATEFSTDGVYRCVTGGNCFDTYTEAWTINFPVPVYDYLPVPIYGYTEQGQRNYGAR